MKKLILMLLLTMLVFPLVASEDIAYIVKNTNSLDSGVINAINELTYTYKVIGESQISATNFSKYKMILVGDDVFSDPLDIPISGYNSLIMNSKYRIEWGLSSRTALYSSPTSLTNNVNFPTAITDGVTSPFFAYSVSNPSVSTYALLGKKPTGIKIVSYRTLSSNTVIALVPPGTTLLNSKKANGKIIYFGITKSQYWTSDSKKMFKNSIKYIISGEDRDQDGYFDNDCNDNDPNINPGATEIPYDEVDQDCNGYDLLDADGDKYCEAEIAIVNKTVQCLLETGSVGTDCDDNFAEINTNETEISYDGIDQNCNGHDLLDADGDGYCKLGLNITNKALQCPLETLSVGTDCNDNSSIINKNATDIPGDGIDQDCSGSDILADIDGDGYCKAGVDIIDKATQCPLETGSVGTDCDDNFAEINTNETEISYDGIDQNCNGHDLLDADGDGYCKLGLNITNKALQCPLETLSVGTDCNDENSVYRPLVSDLEKNCKNDQPILKSNIPELIWDEGKNYTLNLSQYISDPENDNLSYNIKSAPGNGNITLNIINDKVIFSSPNQWFGTDQVIFNISDGEFTIETNQILLNVTEINDPPILEKIKNIIVFEGQLVKIIPNATDSEGDTLTYNFSSPINASGEWKTSIGDEGVYQISVTVSDGHGGSDGESLTITVMPKVVINELASKPINESDWVEIYNTGNTQSNLSLCKLKDGADNELTLEGILSGKNWKVFELSNILNNDGDSIKLICNGDESDKVTYGVQTENAPVPSDGQSIGRITDGLDTNNDANDFKIYNNPTKNFTNSADMDPPIVSLLFPNNNSTILIRDSNFTYSVSDNSQSLSCSLYGNFFGVFKLLQTSSIPLVNESNSSGNFLVKGINDGTYLWNVACKDSRNTAFADNNRTLTVSAPDAPTISPILSQFVQENKTLEFNVDVTDPENNSVSLTAQDLPQGATFSNKVFRWTPDFNQSGSYNVIFKAIDATNLTDEESVNIVVGDVILPPEFKDATKCTNLNESLELSIKSPKNNEKFNINDKIDVEVKVKNNFNERMDFNVEAHLYDLKDDSSLDSNDDSIRIDKGKTETVNLELTIPDDVEDSNKFAIYVFVENDNNECNTAFTNIKIEREDDAMKISKFNINPATTSKGQEIFFEISVENIGADNQDDVILNVYNKELNLDIKSDSFKVEKSGDDDKETKSLTYKIPENVKLGTYNITLDVLFNDNKVSSESSLTIINGVPVFIPVAETNIPTTSATSTSKQTPGIIQINKPTGKTETKKIVNEIKTTKDKKPSVLSELSMYPSYLEDPNVKLALWVLNMVLAIGILAFIIKMILLVKG